MAALVLAALLGAGVGTGGTLLAVRNRPGAGSSGPAISPITRLPNGARDTVTAVAREVLPSIVRIDVRSRGGAGTGSGIVYRSDGYIVTNNHVVEGADEIVVRLQGGESLPATLIGSAAPTVDLAVVKVDRTGLKAAKLGSTQSVQVGDLAVAIGNPLGLDSSVTAGVISALHRNGALGAGVSLTDAIQTDAPLNPGNSGGALADSEGRVIGVNTAVAGRTGAAAGVGFAIPVEIVKRSADQIIATGRAQFAYIGITGETVADGGGARIREVVQDGPAARAGLRPDDVIVALEGTPVSSMEDLVGLLVHRNVGDRVRLEFRRGDTRDTVTVTLAARPTRVAG